LCRGCVGRCFTLGGARGTIILKSGGTVWAWDMGTYGQMGNGAITNNLSYYSDIRSHFNDMSSDEKLGFILSRRSVRVYSPGEISDGLLQKILEAAMAAPSAMTKDPWRFIVIRREATLCALAEALPGGKMLTTAASGIVLCGDLDAAFERQLSFLLQDCSAAMENLLLAAHAVGLGACWIGVHPNEKAAQQLKELLGLPASIIPVAVASLGVPGEEPGPRTRFDQDYVHTEKW
jgi:nitroreductase